MILTFYVPISYMNVLVLIVITLVLAYFAFGNMLTLKEELSTGYTSEFLLPKLWPGQCLCDNGEVGRLAVGAGGMCVCSANGATSLKYKDGVLAPPPGDYDTSGLLWPLRNAQ